MSPRRPERLGRRALLGGAASALAATATAGCTGLLGPGSAGDPDEYDVGMSSVAFLPEQVETTVGEPVVWRNTSSHAHTVTAYGGGLPDGADFFASGGFADETTARNAWDDGFGGSIPARATYEHTFEVPGEYPYFCIPHEGAPMTGTVVVRAAEE